MGALVAAALFLVGALIAAWAAPAAVRSALAGAGVVGLGLTGAAVGLSTLAGASVQVTVATSLPLPPLVFSPDPLGGFFMIVIGLVGAVSAGYGVGYARSGPAASPTMWSAFALLVFALLAVAASADAVSFLFSWELMALTSTALVAAEHRQRGEVRSAGIWYAAMAHLSFLFLLLGFAVLTTAADGATSFSALAQVASDSNAGQWAFALLALGFAAKAGIVPLHVWLPRAHPAAPSHVSALMSAALVKVGVYGILLLVVRLLPGGPSWQGVMLMVLGAASALFGVLQASVASDLKRLLAFSTTENVGLMVLAAGAASLLTSAGASDVASVALVACLLLVASHAALKTGAFLAAGSILHATGERDLDRLGGLVRTMPVTAATFGIAALAAAALPVTGGFVAEWSLLQALIHGDVPGNRVVAVAMPVAVAIVALTTGIALMTFVKAYGIAFLARPRSHHAADAHEAGWAMRLAMLLAAGAVVVIGLLPGPVATAAASALDTQVVAGTTIGGLTFLPFDALLDPVALTLLTAALAIGIVGWQAVAAHRAPRRQVDLVWACGAGSLTPRMQYTATSYAEPLTRVFDDALQQTRDVEVTHAEESAYLVSRVRFSQTVGDVFDTRLFRPLVGMMERIGQLGAWVQNGSIHRYLLYSFIGLMLVLAVAR
ncbi:MAG: hypothetical protein QG597_2843 [Actinomycetota bacterium]|nr:hypothetical protein [Actinomycetota bacterium]